MIIATAGHIDHGKTSLLEALTQVNADRLPEERARGISIDLGFVHAELAPGVSASFIDVPGHERFIHNMLAGVSAIDAALLVVAADDGVMPQTLEHLRILELLAVRRGLVALTKIDRVAPRAVDELVSHLHAELASTALADAPLCPVSSHTGVGLDVLRAQLVALAGQASARHGADGFFRLCIDRAFSVAGYGTVVTGTVLSGSAGVGEQLVISPAGRPARVRGLQSRGRASHRVAAGERCAANLAGVAVHEAGRGNWLVHPALHAPSRRIDVQLTVLASETRALSHWTPVHLHIGTADLPARVALSRGAAIAPGASGFAQLVCEQPISTLHGDRFVLRDQSAQRTVGGGIVLDPFAPKRQRRAPLRLAELRVLEHGGAGEVIAGLLAVSEAGIETGQLARNLNLDAAQMRQALRAADAVTLGREPPLALSRASVELASARVLASLQAHHRAHPQAEGLPITALREACESRLPPAAFEALVRGLADRQRLVLSNDIARLPAHETTANAADQQLWVRVERALARSGVRVPLVAELARRLELPEATLRDFLHRKSRGGTVLRLGDGRFALRATLAQVAASATALATQSTDGFFVAAELRDAIGTGRGLAIHYLELFDRLGITQRFGDRRRIARDFAPLLGASEPVIPPDRKAS